MTTNKDDQAFAGSERGEGLTRREYFAAMALNSVLYWHAELHDTKVTPSIVAIEAVGVADALIAELNKDPKP